MGTFLFQGYYSVNGMEGVLKGGGSRRRKAVEDAVKALGGTVEGCYFSFGETDIYLIVDGFDNETAVAFAMGIAAEGPLNSVKTTFLLTPKEVDAAAKKARSYRARGR